MERKKRSKKKLLKIAWVQKKGGGEKGEVNRIRK